MTTPTAADLVQADGTPMRVYRLATKSGTVHALDAIASYFNDNATRCGLIITGEEISDKGAGVGDATELTCQSCISATAQVGQQHKVNSGRVQLGRAPIKGSGMQYGVAARCLCGWKAKINKAPSKGGQRHIDQLIAAHLAEGGKSVDKAD